jgi:hypothetical protein
VGAARHSGTRHRPFEETAAAPPAIRPKRVLNA